MHGPHKPAGAPARRRFLAALPVALLAPRLYAAPAPAPLLAIAYLSQQVFQTTEQKRLG